jgi:hypothetical protein
MHDMQTVKISSKFLWHGNLPWLSWNVIPQRALARFLFSTNSNTIRHCAPCKEHHFTFTRFLCLTLVMSTILFKTSLTCWCNLFNSFTATFVPSCNIPYKKHRNIFNLSSLKEKINYQLVNPLKLIITNFTLKCMNYTFELLF